MALAIKNQISVIIVVKIEREKTNFTLVWEKSAIKKDIGLVAKLLILILKSNAIEILLTISNSLYLHK